MSENRWQRIEDLFHRAADLEPADRGSLLESACAGDPGLRAEVEALLAADAEPGGGLEQAVAEAAGRLREATDDEALRAGERVGPYAIVGLIGRGGMGAVYRAMRDGEFRMEVALKLLKRGTDTEASLRRFRKERQILAALQHPNIARLLDGGATRDGLPYFAMEYVEGRPLLEHAAPLSTRQRLELFRAVCAAVQYAHQHLIVHRDLKPGNILVTADGTPKLLDFGIAKLLDPESTGGELTLTVAGTRLLTSDYASPEQVRGEPITIASDIYSLGVILYELLTGEHPHRIDTYSPQAIEKAICRDEPKRPSTWNRQLDPDLDNIVLMALRKEPQRRYGSVEQLSEDVRRYLENRPIRARKDTLAYRADKFVRRNKLGLVAAVLALAGLATGIATVRRQARRAEYRFRQVRGLAHTVLFDLNPAIENLTGSMKARELLVTTSLRYLDSLAAEAGDDPGLQLELAQAYEKVADVQGYSKVPNLGHPTDSLESYAKALRIARTLEPSRPALELLARIYSKIGYVQAWEMGRFSEGVESLSTGLRLANSIPGATGDPAYELRAEAYGILGDVYLHWRPDHAAAPYRRELEIAREWAAARPSQESRSSLSRAMVRQGYSLMQTGDLNGALADRRDALRILDDLLREQPTHVLWRVRRNGLLREFGKMTGDPNEFNLGDPKTAAVWFREALNDRERMAAADPDDHDAGREAAETTGELAETTGEWDPAQAEGLFRRSLALYADVLKAEPDDAASREGGASMEQGLGEILWRLGKRGEAFTRLDAAVETMEALHRQNPEHVEFALDLGEALDKRATCRLESRDSARAEQDLQRSMAILDPTFRANPRNLTALRNLADCHRGFGDLAASRSDWKKAGIEYQKSLDLWDRWKEVGTSSVYDQRRRDDAALLVARATKQSLQPSPAR